MVHQAAVEAGTASCGHHEMQMAPAMPLWISFSGSTAVSGLTPCRVCSEMPVVLLSMVVAAAMVGQPLARVLPSLLQSREPRSGAAGTPMPRAAACACSAAQWDPLRACNIETAAVAVVLATAAVAAPVHPVLVIWIGCEDRRSAHMQQQQLRENLEVHICLATLPREVRTFLQLDL